MALVVDCFDWGLAACVVGLEEKGLSTSDVVVERDCAVSKESSDPAGDGSGGSCNFGLSSFALPSCGSSVGGGDMVSTASGSRSKIGGSILGVFVFVLAWFSSSSWS